MHMKLILMVLLMSTLFGGALFGAAGRWDLPFFLAYILLFQVTLVGSGVYFLKTSPGMVQERLRPGPGGKDSVTRPVGALLMLAHLVVAGLDVGRFHWQPHVPFAIQIVALAAIAASLGGSMWAMSVNPFFSTAVRIQRERGHRVITAGPYRTVRHPGYTGTILWFFASPLALGSWWAALPMLPAVPLIVRRTWLEDKLLQEELKGYAEYAQKVRYRLVPGAW